MARHGKKSPPHPVRENLSFIAGGEAGHTAGVGEFECFLLRFLRPF
jgi:hypothetical protein